MLFLASVFTFSCSNKGNPPAPPTQPEPKRTIAVYDVKNYHGYETYNVSDSGDFLVFDTRPNYVCGNGKYCRITLLKKDCYIGK